LYQQQTKPALELIALKLKDHHTSQEEYLNAFAQRTHSLTADPKIAKDFRQEMSRFLSNQMVKETVHSESFWTFLSHLMNDYLDQITQTLKRSKPNTPFKM
jgi:hypothetical protein